MTNIFYIILLMLSKPAVAKTTQIKFFCLLGHLEYATYIQCNNQSFWTSGL